MKTRQIAIGLMMAATVAPSAMAQTVPADVRCVMLSTLFANDAKDERGRQIASATLAFFMGRLDLRANAQVIAAAMRAQSTRQIAIGLMMAATVAPSAMAQTVPADVRCVMLSTLFANDAKDERGRQIASATLAFFMGRLDLRANAQVIAAAMRAQSTTIDPKSAGPAMNACEAQFGHAQQVVREASRIAAPSRK